jgi:amino acid transporter
MAERQYPQELRRSLGLLGNLGITLSGITPAGSLFVIGAVTYRQQGSGAVLSMLLAAVLGLGMALCFAELGAALPFAGGWYYHVARSLGRPIGFAYLIAFILPLPLGLSISPLGAGEYLAALWPRVPVHTAAALMVAAATAVAMLAIRASERVTGAFLAVELALLALLAALGFSHAHQPWSVLLHPQIATAGGMGPASSGVVLAGAATALLTYNGYDAAVLLSEETRGPRKQIARAVLLAFGLSVAAQIIPLTACLLGAPSLRDLASSPAPMSYVVRSLGGARLDGLMTIGIVLALFNSQVASMLWVSREWYGAARDEAFPARLNRWFRAIHPRWHSPWKGTLTLGAAALIGCLAPNVETLVGVSASLYSLYYAVVAVAALVGRWTLRDVPRPWRMPLWPAPPLVALLGIGWALSQQSTANLISALALFGVGGLYYALYLRPRRATRGLLLEPAGGD